MGECKMKKIIFVGVLLFAVFLAELQVSPTLALIDLVLVYATYLAMKDKIKAYLKEVIDNE